MNSEGLIKLLKKRALMHVLFWSLFILSFSLGWLNGGFSLEYFLLNYIGVLIIYAILIYGVIYIAYGLFFQRKRYALALLFFIVLLAGSTHISAWFYNITNAEGRTINMINYLPFYGFLATFALALKIARNAYLTLAKEIELKQDLINQKEYFLRSQIHPHFLFNTLNNFYGLALEKSNELPSLMIRLSNILRHQIYNSESSYILLQNEINYLKDYIELEKIRHADNLSFKFSFPDSVPSNLYIIPSVLIVFFENAFKHSNNISSQLIEISGYLNIEGDEINFLIENSYPENIFPNHEQAQGLGLKNVKNRLGLLGEDSYTLHTQKGNGKYLVSLKMKLKKQ